MAERKARGAAPKSDNDEFADLLRQGQETFDAGEKYEDMSFEAIPDGSGYIGRLSLVEWRKSKAGNLMLWREHVVLEGPCTGQICRDHMMYGSSDYGDGKIRQYVKLVTGEPLPKDAGMMADIVASIIEKYPYDCRFNKSTNNGFCNVDVIELFEVDDKIDVEKLSPEKAEETEAEPEATPAAKSGKAAKAKEPEPAADNDSALLGQLQDFANRQGLDKEMKKSKKDFDSVDDLKEEIGAWTYDPPEVEGGLSQEDVDLLNDIELGDCVKEAPKPAAAKRGKR